MNHKNYLNSQIKTTKKYLSKEKNVPRNRINKFIKDILNEISLSYNNKILCVGARGGYEVQTFQNLGYKNVVGIDLVEGKNVIKMDMHYMKFNNEEFDLIFSSHNLEHSNNPNLVISEFNRVLKGNGYVAIEIPLKFKNNQINDGLVTKYDKTERFMRDVDIIDFTSEKNLLKEFNENFTYTKIYSQTHNTNSTGYKAKQILKIILKKQI